MGRRIDTVVDGKDFDPFATSAITLLAGQVRVASHPPSAGTQSRRSGGPVLPVPQPHGALPQRRAQTQRRTRPDQQRAGRLFDLRNHVHGLRACFGLAANETPWPTPDQSAALQFERTRSRPALKPLKMGTNHMASAGISVSCLPGGLTKAKC
jgi:hypothetical protein